VGKDGRWQLRVKLPAQPGPYEVRLVASDTVAVLRNVLVGEVWICAGQSNMEMPLAGWPPGSPVEGSARAVAEAGIPRCGSSTSPGGVLDPAQIHLCRRVGRMHGFERGRLQRDGFFFGRALQQAPACRSALVHASWGGAGRGVDQRERALRRFRFRDRLAVVATSRESPRRSALAGSAPACRDPAAAGGRRWEDVVVNDLECMNPGFDDARGGR
jgi:sialate O-acetylesterase